MDQPAFPLPKIFLPSSRRRFPIPAEEWQGKRKIGSGGAKSSESQTSCDAFAQQGLYDKETRVNAAELLRKLTYGQSGYFWADTKEGGQRGAPRRGYRWD